MPPSPPATSQARPNLTLNFPRELALKGATARLRRRTVTL